MSCESTKRLLLKENVMQVPVVRLVSSNAMKLIMQETEESSVTFWAGMAENEIVFKKGQAFLGIPIALYFSEQKIIKATHGFAKEIEYLHLVVQMANYKDIETIFAKLITGFPVDDSDIIASHREGKMTVSDLMSLREVRANLRRTARAFWGFDGKSFDPEVTQKIAIL